MKLNENERKVLVVLADECEPDETACGFAHLSMESGLDRKIVRRACRSLTRKGLARYARGLWTEDGEPAGSGYGPTRAGWDFARDIPRPCEGCASGIAEPPGRLCPGCEAYRDHQQ